MFGGFVFLVPVVAIIAVFSWMAVVTYMENRRKERESYYRYEFRSKLVEAGKLDAEQLLELTLREEISQLQRRREGLKLAGIVLVAVGVGMIVGLGPLTDWEVASLGLIPLALGVSILGYALFFAAKIPEVAGAERDRGASPES